MDFIVPGISALLVILGFVAIVMSRRNWRVPQMILLGFILVFALVFFYLAARTLKTHENWETELTKFQTQIDGLHKEIDGDSSNKPASTEGDAQGDSGLRSDRDRDKLAVAAAMAQRGRVWFGAIYERVDIATGEISAAFDQTPPAGLAPKSVVFVFEDKDKGKYLGEFSVTSVNQNKVKLKPATTLQEEINVIAKSRGPWVLYEVMPIDSHTLITEQEPSVLKALMPGVSANALAEFTRDGKPAKYDPTKDAKDQPQGNDPPDRVQVKVRFTKDWAPPSDPLAPKAAPVAAAPAAGVAPAGGAAAAGANRPEKTTFKAGDTAYLDPDTARSLVEPKDAAQKVAEFEKSDPNFVVYVRPLVDYARMFREIYRRRNDLYAVEAELKSQVEQIESAVKLVQDDVKAAADEQAGLKKDFAKFKSENDAVVAFNNALAAKQTEVNAKCSELFRANLKLSRQLADVEQKITDAAGRQPPAETSASLNGR